MSFVLPVCVGLGGFDLVLCYMFGLLFDIWLFWLEWCWVCVYVSCVYNVACCNCRLWCCVWALVVINFCALYTLCVYNFRCGLLLLLVCCVLYLFDCWVLFSWWWIVVWGIYALTCWKCVVGMRLGLCICLHGCLIVGLLLAFVWLAWIEMFMVSLILSVCLWLLRHLLIVLWLVMNCCVLWWWHCCKAGVVFCVCCGCFIGCGLALLISIVGFSCLDWWCSYW